MIETPERDRLILFKKDHYEWLDPWGNPHSESVLQVRAILRPLTDETITRFEWVGDPGYGPENRYLSLGYHLPGVGEVRKLRNVVDYTGGSWWAMPAGVDLVLHDQDTWPRNTRALNMWGHPIATPFPEVQR